MARFAQKRLLKLRGNALGLGSRRRRIGLVAALAVIWTAGWQGPVPEVPGADEQARALGREILGRSMFVFESAALMILTAMIAATMVAIAPQEKDRP